MILQRRTLFTGSVISVFGNYNLISIYNNLKNTKKSFEYCRNKLINIIEKTVPISTDEDRKSLINLKRKVYNRKKIEAYVGSLSEVSNLVTIYADLRQQILSLEQNYNKEWEITKKNEILNIDKLLNDRQHSFFYSPKFIGDSIPIKLEKYLNTNNDKRTKNQKKITIVLTKLITRAATKTSPFSTLTSSSFAKISNINKNNNNTYRTISRLNDTILYRIAEKLLLSDNLILRGKFYIDPTVVTNKEYVFWTTNLDNEDNFKTFKTIDALSKQKNTEIMSVILKEFQNREFSFDDFISNTHIIKLFKSYKLKVSVFKSLVLRKFFVKKTDIPSLSDDLLKEINSIFHSKLKSFTDLEVNEVIKPLRKIESLMNDYDNISPKQQLKKHIEINEILFKICNFLNIKPSKSKDIIYQDYISDKLSLFNLKPYFVEEMQDLMEFYNVFNVPYYFQLLISKDFKNRYGNKIIPLKDNWRNITQYLLNIFLGNLDFWSDQLKITNREFDIKELNLMQSIKNRVLKYIIDSCKKNKTIHIDKEFVIKIINLFPDDIKYRTQSNDFFFQINNSTNKIVVNHFYEGNLMYMLRFFDEIISARQDNDFKYYVNKILNRRNLADIRATFGFNANKRYIYTPHDIKILNNPSNPKSKKTIEFTDMSIYFDNEEKRLVFLHKGSKIRPLFLGTLMPTKLPGLVSSISILSRDFSMYTDFSQFIVDTCIRENPNDDIIVLPQVEFEKHIILSRKKLAIKTSLIKELSNCDILKFFLDHNMPSQFFAFAYVKIDKDSGYKINVKKPQYIDLSSPLLIKVFKDLIPKSNYIIIENIDPKLSMKDPSLEFIAEITRE